MVFMNNINPSTTERFESHIINIAEGAKEVKQQAINVVMNAFSELSMEGRINEDRAGNRALQFVFLGLAGIILPGPIILSSVLQVIIKPIQEKREYKNEIDVYKNNDNEIRNLRADIEINRYHSHKPSLTELKSDNEKTSKEIKEFKAEGKKVEENEAKLKLLNVNYGEIRAARPRTTNSRLSLEDLKKGNQRLEALIQSKNEVEIKPNNEDEINYNNEKEIYVNNENEIKNLGARISTKYYFSKPSLTELKKDNEITNNEIKNFKAEIKKIEENVDKLRSLSVDEREIRLAKPRTPHRTLSLEDLKEGNQRLEALIERENFVNSKQTTGLGELDKIIHNQDVIRAINRLAFSPENGEFLSALNTLAKSPTFNATNLTVLIQDKRLQDPKMQKTIICAAKILNTRTENPTQEIDVKKSTSGGYGFTIDKENNITVRSGYELGKGSFKKAKGAVELQTMQEYASISIKDRRDKDGSFISGSAAKEVKAERDALQDLQGCRNIINPPKFTVVTKGKLGQAKFVLMSKKLAGDGKLLFNAKPTAIVSAMRDVAIGLGDMHERNIIHNDFKLDNMLIDEKGKGYVHDFGLIRKPGEMGGGTPITTAPEIRKGRPITSKADSFSLGICMLQLAAPNRFVDKYSGISTYNNGETQQYLIQLPEQDFKEFIKNAESSIKNDKSLNAEDQEAKLKLINVAKQLLVFNPDERISCEKAGELLA
jgi:hypothetical protein